jgi:alkylation response protein AidB-like acyl-CoA dehydrogenase
LNLAHSVAERFYLPHNALSDQHEPEFDGENVHLIPEIAAGLRAFNDSGILSGPIDELLGGIQLPHVVHRAAFMYFQAANTATAAYSMLTMANANLLIKFGDQTQIDRFVIPMIAGRFYGTMCLSEPQAGSSLSEILTLASPDVEGTFRLVGNKMWISGGDHAMGENIIHLVLARTPGAPVGVKGLSLFAVPKFLVTSEATIGERNDVVLAGLNHKMGYRGTVNTFLSFGGGQFTPEGRGGAVGYLVGEINHGLDYMFHMMNEARIAVGAGATALGYTGYLHALDYANNRSQGRRIGESDSNAPQVPIIEHPDIRRMLLASKSYVEGAMALVLYCASLLDNQETSVDDAELSKSGLLLDILTPVVKSWPSQWCLAANDFAIQIHGGYGYSREFPVEQFYRDNRLNMIHEGTNGIQALDLLGRKVRMLDGASLDALTEEILKSVSATQDSFSSYSEKLQEVWARVLAVTRVLWAENRAATALTNASIYLECFGHAVIAWMWLEQLKAVGDNVGEFYEGKRAAAKYFFTYELPQVEAKLNILESMDSLFMDIQSGYF